ncbi:hypothetical protein QE152_g26268 [Popillia japonica]|uniref:Uncharacterized protein n=1 Tax=Popillia japonica TaxID=7064 RepID=A0AAW1JZ90_POPJA
MDYLSNNLEKFSNNLEKFELNFSVGKCRPDLYSELGLFTNFLEKNVIRCHTLFFLLGIGVVYKFSGEKRLRCSTLS